MDARRLPPRPLITGLLLVVLLASLATLAQQLHAADFPQGPLPVGNEKAGEFSGLHNVFRLSEKLYSGSVPEGQDGFRSLQALGIKTIISVDGAKPDLALAKKYGMRYVHLPFGYDGCPVPTANRIVRAVRDLPDPIYLHCHHGKHRSPTAAAFARIALDGLSPEKAVKEMERAGTGKNYTGLYSDVQAYRPPTTEELDQVKRNFPEVAPTPPLTKTMVQIERRFSALLLTQKEGWKAPAGQPDLKPEHEALQLQELFTEVNRTAALKGRAADFRRWMSEGERNAKALEAALRAGKSSEASASLGKLAAGCGSCHAAYRDVPQQR